MTKLLKMSRDLRKLLVLCQAGLHIPVVTRRWLEILCVCFVAIHTTIFSHVRVSRVLTSTMLSKCMLLKDLLIQCLTFYHHVTILPRHLSRLMGKPTICICENKDADQLRSDCEADQHLCFRYSDSTISLLLKSEISSF